MLLALGARSYDEALAEHVAGLFHSVLERRGAGPEEAALAIGAPADTWQAAGPGLRRVRRSAGAATALPVRRWYLIEPRRTTGRAWLQPCPRRARAQATTSGISSQ